MPFDFGDELSKAYDGHDATRTVLEMTGHAQLESEHRGSDESAEAAASTAEPERPASLTDAAVRDAAAIADRIVADEGAADAERERLAREPLPVLDRQTEILFQMAAGERLHAERRAALVERGQDAQPSGGTLYLTSRRLVHIGSEGVEEIRLDAITDMAVAMERLLLVELDDGSDLAIEVDQPRLLRVQVSAARAGMRDGTA